MTTLPEHGWYMRQMDDAADYGEAVAERLWHGPRIVSPSPRYDVAAVIDSIIDGTYEAKPIPVPQSLNAAFDDAVRQVRDNARRVA